MGWKLSLIKQWYLIFRLSLSQSKYPGFFHILLMFVTGVAMSTDMCICVCVYQHACANLLATMCVHSRVMHGQPLYSTTVALEQSVARQIAAGICEVRRGTSPQFSEGQTEASLGWQSKTDSSGVGELTDGFWVKDSLVSQVNDGGSLGMPWGLPLIILIAPVCVLVHCMHTCLSSFWRSLSIWIFLN